VNSHQRDGEADQRVSDPEADGEDDRGNEHAEGDVRFSAGVGAAGDQRGR
jgi:hypothetical protein